MFLAWLLLFLAISSTGGSILLGLLFSRSIRLQIGLEPYGRTQVWWAIHLAAASFLTNIYTVSSSLIELFLIAVSLVGQSAPPEMLQKLTYLVIRHHPRIKRVDTVRAYTFGVLYFVEVIWWCDLSRSRPEVDRRWNYYSSVELNVWLCPPAGWHRTPRRFTSERSPCDRRIAADKDRGTTRGRTCICASRLRMRPQAGALHTRQAAQLPSLSRMHDLCLRSSARFMYMKHEFLKAFFWIKLPLDDGSWSVSFGGFGPPPPVWLEYEKYIHGESLMVVMICLDGEHLIAGVMCILLEGGGLSAHT